MNGDGSCNLDSISQETCDKFSQCVIELKEQKGVTNEMKLFCTHGGRNHATLLNIFGNTMKDIKRFVQLPDGSSEIEEIKEKVLRTHKALLDEEGNSILLKEVYAYCANMILLEEAYSHNSNLTLIDAARDICYSALVFEQRVAIWDDHDLDGYRPLRIQRAKNTIQTDQQLFVHVSKRIPCKCVRRKRKEMGLVEDTLKCERCKVERPWQEMCICPICQLTSYCSDICQHEDWKTHKKECLGVKTGLILAIPHESGKS